jgi:ribonuclease J
LSGKLRILPLGGLGEIGKNMTVVEYEGRIVVVDTGLMFPTPDQLGVDLVLPDFAYLRDRAKDIEAIVLTHGHEDHVGALPFLLREIGPDHSPPVYGGPLTTGLVRSKLDEHKLSDSVELRDVKAGETIDAGPFSVETIRLSHSIPDCLGMAITCELGTTLITGDYKFDQTPVDGKPADMARLAELGREGILLLCGDSTNVDRQGVALSESMIGPRLEEAIARCRGRVVVTCFASNVHRVQQVVDAAAATGRKVSLVGRSMRKNVNIARGLGLIHVPDGMLVGVREIQDFPDHKLVVISTGSQGEPLSALRRMAHGDHPQVELREGDTVLFSATPIPGNERAVNETISRIYQLGADVVTARDAPIHASGHGYAEELKMMINLTSPRYVMPFHGDFRRMRLHRELAETVGVPKENGFLAANGTPLEIDSKGARLGEREHAGMIFVDGMEVGDVEDIALRDRRMLSADGIFIVVATVSEQDGRSVAPPEIIFRGVPFLEGAGEDILDDLRMAVDESLARSAKEHISEIDLLQGHLHDDVARFVYERLKRRPMVLPVVVEV